MLLVAVAVLALSAITLRQRQSLVTVAQACQALLKEAPKTTQAAAAVAFTTAAARLATAERVAAVLAATGPMA